MNKDSYPCHFADLRLSILYSVKTLEGYHFLFERGGWPCPSHPPKELGNVKFPSINDDFYPASVHVYNVSPAHKK